MRLQGGIVEVFDHLRNREVERFALVGQQPSVDSGSGEGVAESQLRGLGFHQQLRGDQDLHYLVQLSLRATGQRLYEGKIHVDASHRRQFQRLPRLLRQQADALLDSLVNAAGDMQLGERLAGPRGCR